jgi:hydroxymethylpyrimidine/phosphomethylpyrimidine kinase
MTKKTYILSIGGFDGTGGAGIALDSRVFSRYKIPHITIQTSLVIQNPVNVYKQVAIAIADIEMQLQIITKYYPITVVNIGVIYSAEILSLVKKYLHEKIIIWDPVFSSGNGLMVLMNEEEIKKSLKHLNMLYLLTPNLPELEKISGQSIQSVQDLKNAVDSVFNQYNIHAMLVKGGHTKNEIDNDWLILENRKWIKNESKKRNMRIHGTGSFLNCHISRYLFKGYDLPMSFHYAKTRLKDHVRKVSINNPILMAE